MTRLGLQQQTAVYAADARVDVGAHVADYDDAQAWLDEIVAADWFTSRHYNERCRRFVVCEQDPRRSNEACAAATVDEESRMGEIHCPLRMLTQQTLLHESAHLLTPGTSHGPTWVRAYLELVYFALGGDAYLQLYHALEANGVDIDHREES